MQCDDLKEYEAWLVTRKAAGEAIDIATCKFMWRRVQVLDPYGYRGAAGTFPEEEDCIGWDYFVCSENSDGWIWYGDLPKEKKHALDERIKREASDEHWIFDEIRKQWALVTSASGPVVTRSCGSLANLPIAISRKN